LADLFGLRLTRPFEAFVGHRTILGGRFHEMRTSKMRLPHVGQAKNLPITPRQVLFEVGA
jgi:hypothetical protein